MAQLRSVNTKFWEDPWVETLCVSDKLLFLYLVTNSYANLAGVYEITIRRISFETGLEIETIRKGLKGFERVRKAYFVNESYMFLPNWLKNQNLNGNMKVGVIKIICALPTDVKTSILGNHYLTIQKDYQTILNTLLKYEVLEEEVLEEEVLEEEVLAPKSFSFKNSITSLGVSEQTASDWIKIKKTKTLTSFNQIKKQIQECKYTPEECVIAAADRGWQTIKSDWVDNYYSNTIPTVTKNKPFIVGSDFSNVTPDNLKF